MVTACAAAGRTPLEAARLRDALRFRAVPRLARLVDFRAGSARLRAVLLRVALLRVLRDAVLRLRALDRRRPDTFLRARPRAVDVFLVLALRRLVLRPPRPAAPRRAAPVARFLPPLDPPRDDFLAAAMILLRDEMSGLHQRTLL